TGSSPPIAIFICSKAACSTRRKPHGKRPSACARPPGHDRSPAMYIRSLLTAVWVAGTLAGSIAAHAQTSLLNASYDPTREFYADVNKQFAVEWKKQTGET